MNSIELNLFLAKMLDAHASLTTVCQNLESRVTLLETRLCTIEAGHAMTLVFIKRVLERLDAIEKTHVSARLEAIEERHAVEDLDKAIKDNKMYVL